MRCRKRHRWCHALTLVEVIASLAMLSGTVTALLLAHARASHQSLASREREQAAVLAESLLIEWRLLENNLQAPEEGVFATHPGWSWQREFEGGGSDPDAAVIRLAIRHARPGAGSAVVAEYTWIEPVDGP